MTRLLALLPCQFTNWCDVYGGIGINLASTMIEIIMGAFVVVLGILIKQGAKKSFFSNGSNRFIAMTSRVNVTSSNDFRGQGRTFAGAAIPDYEIVALRHFSRLFNFDDTSLRDLPWTKKIMFLRFPTLAIETSPNRSIANENDISSATTIFSIGSPGYNALSEYIESTANLARFINNNSAIELNNQTSSNNPFLIQRIRRSGGGFYFYLAGCSIAGTSQAINTLILNWKSYRKRFRNRDFAILFEIRNGTAAEIMVVVR